MSSLSLQNLREDHPVTPKAKWNGEEQHVGRIAASVVYDLFNRLVLYLLLREFGSHSTRQCCYYQLFCRTFIIHSQLSLRFVNFQFIQYTCRNINIPYSLSISFNKPAERYILHISLSISFNKPAERYILHFNIHFIQEACRKSPFELVYSFSGLFDWKKDRKFFARFEDPNSPEKEASTVESESFFSSACIFHRLLHLLGSFIFIFACLLSV